MTLFGAVAFVSGLAMFGIGDLMPRDRADAWRFAGVGILGVGITALLLSVAL